MTVYYNEIDAVAAQWLRNLIDAGHIAFGDVDERSIEDVRPDDLRNYIQCHFFAGIGVWSYALRRAGWPDDRPVWTGSCPCQPFSAAGKGVGFADERHLWPAWHHLISQCRPDTVFGEQVASKDADAWIDLVHTDMEALGYAFGAVPFPSAGVGAPHIRDRLYWVADSHHARLERRRGVQKRAAERTFGARRLAGGLADLHGDGCEPGKSGLAPVGYRTTAESDSGSRGLADDQLQQRSGSASGGDVPGGRNEEPAAAAGLRGDSDPGPTNGFWRDADWLGCRDGKWRPVEPGTFPLAHGAAGRVGRLRAYGNAINAQAAEAMIRASMEIAA